MVARVFTANGNGVQPVKSVVEIDSFWSLNQKISGMVFVKPSISALNYGRDMEIETANTFIEFIKEKHKDIKLSDCGLFVDKALAYVGASPDRISLC